MGNRSVSTTVNRSVSWCKSKQELISRCPHQPGLDDLLAASLERRAAYYAVRLLPEAGDRRSAREQILHVFEQLESQAGAPEFKGCAYLAVQIEVNDHSHPASRVAHRVKGNLTAFFRAEAERGGASDPELLARQLMVVFDGAGARAGIGANRLTGLVAPTVA
ncbi:hypothetical protein OG252_00885 [Streptomyces sp. NBC_01352]|uniref:hypothetical protein n=1 Tax=Streptomyces sp. NBC_01352 TaxID=2903834 RepID=UPI002E37EEAD|nr:hypothetical protein [Streptomyces sp. NBC_01352]